MSKKPTLLIAHGAFHQASHYDTFKLSLNNAGIDSVLVPQLPSSGSSPPEDAFAKDVDVLQQSILQLLDSGKDAAILAHSYGGIPLTEALTGVQNASKDDSKSGKVLGIMFVAAMVPEDGENLATAMKTGVAPWVKIEGDICYAANPGETFYNTLSPQSLVAGAAAQVTPQATSAFITPATKASWKEYPCMYVKCLKDNSTSLEDQDHMVVKMQKAAKVSGKDVKVVELESDHCPMICMPDRLSRTVLEFVVDVGSS